MYTMVCEYQVCYSETSLVLSWSHVEIVRFIPPLWAILNTPSHPIRRSSHVWSRFAIKRLGSTGSHTFVYAQSGLLHRRVPQSASRPVLHLSCRLRLIAEAGHLQNPRQGIQWGMSRDFALIPERTSGRNIVVGGRRGRHETSFNINHAW